MIYEPFDDADPTLSGNTPGTGLTGTWGAGSIAVTTGSLSYGSLATSGNHAVKSGGGFQYAWVDPGTTLSSADLLADGAVLWFSALAVSDNTGGIRRTYIALGNGAADGFDRIGDHTGGAGFAIKLDSGTVGTHGWEEGGAFAFGGASDYTVWAALYPGADLSDPNADYDGDGLTNSEERLFGLDSTTGTSVSPVSIPLDNATGTSSYTRRDPSLSGFTYTVWTSTNLEPGSWVQDTGASQVPGIPDAFGVETVAVTLSSALLDEPVLFARIEAVE